jgi:hypothetical protein
MFNSRHGQLPRGVSGEAFSVIAFATISLSACSVVGPASIDHGRTSYNEVIEDTSRQQALLNVVRVSNGESPLFIDVTEVDAATSAGGTLGGGVSGLGATANFKSTSAGTIQGPVEAISLFSSFWQRSHCSSVDMFFWPTRASSANQTSIASGATPFSRAISSRRSGRLF